MGKLQLLCPYCKMALEYLPEQEGQSRTCAQCQMPIALTGGTEVRAAPVAAEQLTMRCPYCQAGVRFRGSLVGQTAPCPKCQMPITLAGEAAAPPAPVPAEAGHPPTPTPPPQPTPTPPAPPGPPPTGPRYLERMKANRPLAGRICPKCQQGIELGDDVFNCQQCLTTMHLACREAHGGCFQCQPPAATVTAGPGEAPLRLVEAVPDDRPRVECRFCRELIPAGARQCGSCGEYQSDADRNIMNLTAQKAARDDKLAWWEILLGVLCNGIGCIVGIVYAVQGKKKGIKLIILSVVVGIIGVIIQLIIALAQHK